MTAPTTLTIDLEDHRPDDTHESRLEPVTRDLLERLEEIGARATVFVVGEVAEAHPDLISDIAAGGHELGLHDWAHVHLDKTTPEQLRADTDRGRKLLEDLAQTPVSGYRAPTFSLVADTRWAADVLAEVGFEYSSSVLPARNPLYGYPGAPTTPFTWPSGLLELPVPIADLGALKVPTGGTYLRVLPRAAIERRALDVPVPFVYCHPYDFDTEEPFWWEPTAGAMAPLLWVGRRGLWDKLRRLLTPPGPPLRERLDEARAVAHPFHGEARASGSQAEMMHRLPKARSVDRIGYLAGLAAGRTVTHVGFVDSGYREMQDSAGTWLHAHLARVARRLVGIDLDVDGVAAAVAAGHEAHALDCQDPDAVRAAGIEPAELVIAGEVIEHLESPGPFLSALHALVAPGGEMVLTTPNASGLTNTVAALAGREINHPDHVAVFSWRTLSTLLGRHGWEVVETATFQPTVKAGAGGGSRLVSGAARVLMATERVAARLGAPYLSDGLIVRCRAVR